MPPSALIDRRSAGLARLSLFSLLLFPIIVVVFAVILVVDEAAYLRVLAEDRPVEWLTVAGFVLAAILAIRLLARTHADDRARRWFLGAFAIFALFVALEEISWGQRVFGVRSPEFFRHNSDQREINVHNVLQQWSGLTSKLAGGLAFFAYGVVLPLAARRREDVRRFARRLGVVVPPLALSGGFFLGSVLMFDQPTHEEEEIAELVYALCLVLVVCFEDLGIRAAKKEGAAVWAAPSKPRRAS